MTDCSWTCLVHRIVISEPIAVVKRHVEENADWLWVKLLHKLTSFNVQYTTSSVIWSSTIKFLQGGCTVAYSRIKTPTNRCLSSCLINAWLFEALWNRRWWCPIKKLSWGWNLCSLPRVGNEEKRAGNEENEFFSVIILRLSQSCSSLPLICYLWQSAIHSS